MARTKKKYYAVATGHKPGIYTEWFGPDGAQVQIVGFTGARYKGFASREEAEGWLENSKTAGRRKTSRISDVPRVSENLEGYVIIYTDGGSINNPGPGGYGIVIIEGDKRLEISGGFRKTTNNRMELMGVIVALNQFEKPVKAIVRTDSQYVVNGIMKGWARRWQKNGWMRTKNEPAENCDLWEQLLEMTMRHHVIIEWVKGHAGHDENERCDALAREASAMRDLPGDTNYEQGRTTVLQNLF
ncbi:MAG: ribonuclease HI [Deltaproteobacteria bacterium]|nr:ribonuclease HI [Deltaproteobacteria bacterium]